MTEYMIINIITNSAFLGVIIWIALTQIKRIDGHDSDFRKVLEVMTLLQQDSMSQNKRTDGHEKDIKKILEIMANTQRDLAVMIERTKHI